MPIESNDDRPVFPDVLAAVVDPSGRVRRDYQLLVETVDVVTSKAWQYMRAVIFGWRPWLYRRVGARLVAASSTLTAQPGRVVHVWRVPWEFSLAEMHARVADDARTDPNFAALYEYIRDATYDVLVPTYYDPPRCWTRPTPPAPCACLASARAYAHNVRLMDVAEVKPGQLAALADTKLEDFVPWAAKQEVRLLAAGSAVSGSTRRVVHLWAMPDSDRLTQVMKRASEIAWYQKLNRVCLEAENQNLLIPQEWYDPRPWYDVDKGCWLFNQ